MSPKLHLKVAEPCHENWNEMSPTGQGRYCGSCQKQVVDFSGMDDAQLVQFFKKPSTGSICGRFMSEQLERDLVIPRKRLNWFKYFLSLAIPAFFVMKSSGQRTVGKIAVDSRDTSRIPIDREIRTLGMVLPTTIKPVCEDSTTKPRITNKKVDHIKVQGKIVDEEGKAIPGASVMITESGKILEADNEGRFSFISDKNNLVEFLVTSTGFQPQPYIYPFALQYSSEVDITVQMKKQLLELEEVVVSGIICRRQARYVLGGATIIVGEEVKPDSVKSKIDIPRESSVKFYPNPINSGQVLHISLAGLEEGYYRYEMIEISGKLAQQTEIWIDKDARLMDIRIPLVSSGTYIAILTNKKTGKRYSEKIIVN